MPDGAKRKGVSTMPEKPMTTATALTQFRKDLIDGGFSHEAAETIATIAAKELVQTEGLGVRA